MTVIRNSAHAFFAALIPLMLFHAVASALGMAS